MAAVFQPLLPAWACRSGTASTLQWCSWMATAAIVLAFWRSVLNAAMAAGFPEVFMESKLNNLLFLLALEARGPSAVALLTDSKSVVVPSPFLIDSGAPAGEGESMPSVRSRWDC